MAGGVPAIGTPGEPGPEEIAAVRRRDAPRRAARPARARGRDPRRARPSDGAAARANVEANFTWEQCGEATLAAYEDALR